MSRSKSSGIKKILNHPDREEIIARLVMDISPEEIAEGLEAKYQEVGSQKFIISASALKSFKDNALDIYNTLQEDIQKAKLAVIANQNEDLEMALSQSTTYKDLIVRSAQEELDIRKTVKNMCNAIEHRAGQLFDTIQSDPTTINTKLDRLLVDLFELLGNTLEKYYKITEGPQLGQTTNYNVSVQMIDQNVSAIIDAIRETLAEMDLEASLSFMEKFNNKISKLKAPDLSPASIPSSETRLIEAKLLSETISSKIN